MRVSQLKIPEEAKRILVEAGYDSLWPPQREAIEAGVLEGKNLVLASPTASGKTLIAELCILNNTLRCMGKALYLTPLRALANEKFEEFQRYRDLSKTDGSRIKIATSTGDYDSSDEWLQRYDIIISTNEKVDSLLRHKARWISEVGTIVADEIHLLTDQERGPTLEVTLTKLMKLNPKSQILALSATVKNAEEVAHWIRGAPVTTEWRPVPLKEGVFSTGEVQFKDGSARRISEETGRPALDIALESVRNGGQALIFTETRRTAVQFGKKSSEALHGRLTNTQRRILGNLAGKVLSTGEKTRLSELLAEQISSGAGFHHAGLAAAHRRIVENAFKAGHLKILAATPTLAAGVNLPARTVVISSYERYEPGYGRYPISVLEYKQYSGRAGRPTYDNYGESILVAKTADEQEYLMERYVCAEPEKVWSKLSAERVLRPHVLSTIATGFAHTEEGLYDFFSGTFYAQQNDLKSLRLKVGGILKFLAEEGMVKIESRNVSATRFGRRVSELYIDPISAVVIRDGLDNRPSRLTEISLLQLIAHTPDITPKTRPRGAESERLSLFADEHSRELMFKNPEPWNLGLSYQQDYEDFLAELRCVMVLEEWIRETSEDDILRNHRFEPGDLLRLTQTSEWLMYAAEELAKLLEQKDLIRPIKLLRMRIRSGVKEDLVELAQLEGVGRVRARMLHNSGFHTIADLRKASLGSLTVVPTIGITMAKKIKDQVGGRLKAEEWDAFKNGEIFDEQKLMTEY
ncbi:DEAD/DEAH box helicase [Candidatus Bathyarchaeota archaeon]|nr:DEAD/DEAH box helicase [Candidatus Bathyarchaeota archaeon]